MSTDLLSLEHHRLNIYSRVLRERDNKRISVISRQGAGAGGAIVKMTEFSIRDGTSIHQHHNAYSTEFCQRRDNAR